MFGGQFFMHCFASKLCVSMRGSGYMLHTLRIACGVGWRMQPIVHSCIYMPELAMEPALLCFQTAWAHPTGSQSSCMLMSAKKQGFIAHNQSSYSRNRAALRVGSDTKRALVLWHLQKSPETICRHPTQTKPSNRATASLQP